MVQAGTLVLCLAICAALVSSLFLAIGVATDHWETITFDLPTLRGSSSFNQTLSFLDSENHFYQVAITETQTGRNASTTYYYFRDMYGGIWQLCDRISGIFREGTIYQEALAQAPYLQYACYDYVTEYEVRRESLTDNGRWIMRMQNSAASCSIVSLLCLLCGVLSGTYGAVQKQVTACMVTSVMYIVSGVFDCFTLIIMHTKVNALNNECAMLDPIELQTPRDDAICRARTVHLGWSIPFAWLAFVMLLFAFVTWALLSRFYRIEKASMMI